MVLALLLTITTPAVAAAEAPTPVSAEAAPAETAPSPAPAPVVTPPREQRVCRTIQRTGTRLSGRRICRTASEQREAEASARETTRDMQRDSSGNVDPSPIGGGN